MITDKTSIEDAQNKTELNDNERIEIEQSNCQNVNPEENETQSEVILPHLQDKTEFNDDKSIKVEQSDNQIEEIEENETQNEVLLPHLQDLRESTKKEEINPLEFLDEKQKEIINSVDPTLLTKGDIFQHMCKLGIRYEQYKIGPA